MITECTAAFPHTSLCPRFTACKAGTKSYSSHEFFHCMSQTPAFSCFECNCFKAIVCSFSAVLPGKDLLMWPNYYLHRLSNTKNQSHPQPGSSCLNVASKTYSSFTYFSAIIGFIWILFAQSLPTLLVEAGAFLYESKSWQKVEFVSSVCPLLAVPKPPPLSSCTSSKASRKLHLFPVLPL